MTRSACILVLSTLFFTAGCGGRSTSDYIPSTDNARRAVTIALDAWKAGQSPDPAGKLPSGTSVKAIDMDWSGGRKLSSYEIVGDVAGEETGPKKITVKLKYEGGEALDATYHIVGIDPVQVFRDKDYDRYFGSGK